MFVIKIAKFGTELVINLPRALIRQLSLVKGDYLVLNVKSDKLLTIEHLERVLQKRRLEDVDKDTSIAH